MKSTFFINWGFCTGATRRPSHMRELIDVWRKIRMLRELPKRQRLAEMQIDVEKSHARINPGGRRYCNVCECFYDCSYAMIVEPTYPARPSARPVPGAAAMGSSGPSLAQAEGGTGR